MARRPPLRAGSWARSQEPGPPWRPGTHLAERAAAAALLLPSVLWHRQGPHLRQVLVAALPPTVDAAPAAGTALAPLADAGQRLMRQPVGAIILQAGTAGRAAN